MSQAIILLYDVTDQKSFDEISSWHKNIEKLKSGKTELFLVGTKADESGKRLISKQLGLQFAKQRNMHFMEISSKKPKTVSELLDKITIYVGQALGGSKKGSIGEETYKMDSKACGACIVV